MSLFRQAKQSRAQQSETGTAVPITHFDVTKEYDIYCSLLGEERLYEKVTLAGIRTFDKITEFSSGALCGFLEIEGANGARMLIPQHGIQMICEHGVQPTYRVLRRWMPPDDDDSWRKGSDE